MLSHIFTATVDIWAQAPPLHENFQQTKSAESSQPALSLGHHSVAAQCWHLGRISTADRAEHSWTAPLHTEQPTQFLPIAGVHAHCEKTL